MLHPELVEGLLFEGTLTLDGQPIPARLTLEIDRRELARLLANTGESGEAGSRVAEASALPAIAAGAARPQAKGGFEPIEIRQHPGRRITSEIFAQISDPAKIWAALAERFPWAGFKVPAGGELAAGDIDIPGDTISQLDSDWLTIEPHLDELVSDTGRPERGYQSRIAEYLGGTNDGHFRRARVEPLVARFKRWVEEEWVFSSSSSPDDEADESDETGESARVA